MPASNPDMRVTTLTATAMIALALACACRRDDLSRPIAPDDYAVYAAVLEHCALRNGSTASCIFVVLDATESCSAQMMQLSEDTPAKWARSVGHPEDLRSTVADFCVQAQHDAPLQASFPVSGKCFLTRKAVLDSMLCSPSSGWAAFAALYPSANPRGIFLLSRVGFTSDHLKALVYCAKYCGPLCGSGGYYFLSKEDGTWRVLFCPGGGWIS
jgi:hypothetical protein